LKFSYDFMFLRPRTVARRPPKVERDLKPRPPFIREEGLKKLDKLTRGV
jgi:hypothetical protein